jgi:hypothetical protein
MLLIIFSIGTNNNIFEEIVSDFVVYQFATKNIVVNLFF